MILPSVDHRRSHLEEPADLTDGLDQSVHGLIGLARRRPGLVAGLRRRAENVMRRVETLRSVDDVRLRGIVRDHHAMVRRQSRACAQAVTEAMAAIVEVAARRLGLRAHPVQVMGALALHDRYLAEMATGEGKSLTACLVTPLAAWTGRPSFVVTANDYLAERDAVEMRAFFDFCDISVGSVTGTMDQDARRDVYARGLVYTTSHQLLADFLRDRLRMGLLQHPTRRLLHRMITHQARDDHRGLVQRGLDFALVDEADSVLIDEAVTPLIIAQASENRPLIDASRHAVAIASSLVEGPDFTVDLRWKEVRITEEGQEKVESLSEQLGGIWCAASRRIELVTQALTARELFRRDKQYVVQDDQVVIVDEFTGRLMPERTWSHGLHQAVQAKEGVGLTSPTETLARLSFQRFFRRFRHLCGMTGTALEAAGEFWHVYDLPVVAIPTHAPCRRVQYRDAVYAGASVKLDAIVRDIADREKTGRPQLVGTRNVRASEELSARLTARGLGHQVLNATRHQQEAGIIALAGQRGRITIATNMAGRGTDIKLGPGVAELGGLHVIATERNESLRIDRQLFGRGARQGDPGSAQAFVSPDDEVIGRFVAESVRDALAWTIRKGILGSRLCAAGTVAWAQSRAQAQAWRQRREVLRMDEWLEDALSFTGPTGGA